MAKAPWVNFRPEIKVLDCSIRDGGLINDHMFEDGLVHAVYQTCVDAGIDMMEIGYKADKKIFAPDKYGCWKHCNEDDVRRIVGDNDTDLKIAVMADAEKTDYHNDILPKDQSPIDIIRVATYITQIPIAVDMVKDAYDKGYEVHINLMALSTVQDRELDEALEIFAQTPATTFAIVDSFGSLYPEQVRDYANRFLKAIEGTDKQVAIHAHNNQQLAFGNTIEAIVAGVNRIDATMAGIGRGAGNCPMELLISFLRNPKFNLRPILKCLEDYYVPLRQKIEWGALVPYLITAHFNQHPRSAIQIRAGDDKDKYVDFYDHWTEA
jgi:4-hydroxy 2-oxovalerate aldolase